MYDFLKIRALPTIVIIRIKRQKLSNTIKTLQLFEVTNLSC